MLLAKRKIITNNIQAIHDRIKTNLGNFSEQVKPDDEIAIKIFFPIYLYINRYGFSNLNQWDGNNITINKEGDQYIGYGIEIWKAGERIQSVPDIFLHIYDAKTLADLCNRIQLDPIHFSDVVEDCLP